MSQINRKVVCIRTVQVRSRGRSFYFFFPPSSFRQDAAERQIGAAAADR